MSHILLTGIVTLDIINYLDSYPKEDSEVRATSQQIRRGGNASNTATVLSQLGHDCLLAATLSNDSSAQWLRKDLTDKHIKLQPSNELAGHTTPTSYITLNTENGSRSIIHYRDLPELTFHQFDEINLEKTNWFHFEGRNINETLKMMKKSRSYNKRVSLELEKDRDDIETLIPLADIICFSRSFAKSNNYTRADDCLNHYSSIYPNKLLICTWGAKGAFAKHNNLEYFSPAFHSTQAIDTIGAGDTFNAGFIHAQLKNLSTQDSLTYACKLSGLKCSQSGFTNLEEFDVK